MGKPLVELMLDSGAFSAWQRGTTINVKDYARYLHDHKDLLFSYVTMDVIPGKFGIKRTQADVDKAAEASYSNHQKLKDAGLSPIPVFHQGERWKYLERYLKDGERWIALSASKEVASEEHRIHFDNCFSMLTDDLGRPIVKTHGLAITNHPFLRRYPFTTVDSTTWSLGPSYGHILVPPYPGGRLIRNEDGLDYVGGHWDYNAEKPHRYVISGIEQRNKSAQDKQHEWLAARHVGQKDRVLAVVIAKYLREEIGITVTDARYDTVARRKAVILCTLKFAEHLRVERFLHRHNDRHAPGGPKPIKVKHVKVMFATTFKNRVWADLMTDIGANARLLSYWETGAAPSKELEHFVMTGRCIGAPKNKRSNNLQRNWKGEGYRNHRRLKLAKLASNTREALK